MAKKRARHLTTSRFDRWFAAVAFRQTGRAITLALGSGGCDGMTVGLHLPVARYFNE